MRIFFALFFFISITSSASANDMTIAVYQAPEAGLGVCVGTNTAKTIKCAQQKCVAESGLSIEDCIESLVCSPMEWTADIFMQHKEGNHWHEYVCGQGSKALLDQAVAAKCKSEWLIECDAVQVWRPDGTAVAAN